MSETRGNNRSFPISFPTQLMNIINDESNSIIISWLPCGRGGFIIKDKNEFTKMILPKYFSAEAKWASFARRLNRWHFVFSRTRKDEAIYFHPDFLRGNRESCEAIQPKPQRCYRKNKGKQKQLMSFTEKMKRMPSESNGDGNGNGHKLEDGRHSHSGLQDARLQQLQQQFGQDQILQGQGQGQGQTVAVGNGNSIHPMVLSAQDHMQGFNANALPPLGSNAQRQAPISNYVFNNHLQSNVNTAPHQFSIPGAYQQFLPQQQPVPQTLHSYPTVNVNSPQMMQTPMNVNAMSSADARGRLLAAYPQMAMMAALDPTSMVHNPYSISAKPIAAPHNNSNNVTYPSNGHGQIEQPNMFNLQGTNTKSPSFASSQAAMTEDLRNSSATGTGTGIGMLNHNSSQGRDYSQAFATNNDGNSVQPGTRAVHMDSAGLKQEPRYELTNAANSNRFFQRQDEKLESLKLSLLTADDNEQHVQDPKSMTQSNLSSLMGYNNFTGKAGILSNDTPSQQRQTKMESSEATDSIQAFTMNKNLDSQTAATNGVQLASDGIPEGVKNFAGV